MTTNLFLVLRVRVR